MASASMALSRGFGDFLSLRLVLGFAETVGPVASIAFIRSNFSGPEQGLPTSIYIAGQTFGPACAALVGSALLTSFGWRLMFAVTGLGALLWAPVWLYCSSAKPVKRLATNSPRAKPLIPWRAVLSSPTIWTMSACVFFFSYYWYFVLTWLPAYLSIGRGFSTMRMGTILSIPLFAMAGVNVATGWWADRIAKRGENVFRVRLRFACAGLLGSSAILLLNLIPGRSSVLPILIVSICCFGVASSSFWTLAQHAPPSELVGRAIGYLNTISQLGGVAAPLITGWSLGPQRNFTVAIALAGSAPLVSLVLLLLTGSAGLDRLKLDLSCLPAESNAIECP
jgi:MFS family permease